MKALLIILTVLTTGCAGMRDAPPIVEEVEPGRVALICRMADKSNASLTNNVQQSTLIGESGRIAGCQYWAYDGCHIVIPRGDKCIRAHETRHCEEGDWHLAGYTVDDMAREERCNSSAAH